MGHGWVTAPVGSQKTKASEFTYGLEKEKEKKMYFVTKIVLTYCEKKIVLVIVKNF